MKNVLSKSKKLNYRHYICIFITLVFLGLGVFYLNFIPRLLETFRDFGMSIAYYFCELFLENNPINATVNMPIELKWFDDYFEPLSLLPMEFEEFKQLWDEYWFLVKSETNFQLYLYSISDFLYVMSKFLLVLMPLVVLIIFSIKKTLETVNHNDNVDSKQLRVYKKFSISVISPIKNWLISFAVFLKNTKYLNIWTWLWALYFNVVGIIVAFLAYYFFLISSFDFTTIYNQVLKLVEDLTPMIRTVPVFVWIVLVIAIFCYICRKIGYDSLYHKERCNRGFVNERGVVTIVYGAMGVGKTALITDMALSAEVEMRDMAFEILLESDYKYPSFPWVNLRRELKRAIDKRIVVDMPSCRKLVTTWALRYYQCAELYNKYCRNKAVYKSIRRHKFPEYKRFGNLIFGYDDVNYPTTYNDKLKVTNIWETIEDYSCAYLIYTVQSSLIFSNYSIRTDNVMMDIGNFPLWNTDFFKRDSRLLDSFSRHAHILDFDMLRLGKRMLENNPNRNAFGFGVYVVSEIDKERKNALELQETKAKTDECNQKNDLFNSCLKMSRHACVINNRVFLKILCDLQRPEDWGAGGREVGEVVFVKEKGDMVPTLPFFSPFYAIEGIFLWLKGLFDGFYTEFIHNRSDNILLVHFLKNTVAKLSSYCTGVNNTFGAQTLHLDVESGRMDGEAKKRKYYRMPKKIYSKRYATNCLSAIFQNGEVNTVYVDDFIEYVGIMATRNELDLQHSHFQRDLKKAKELILTNQE